MADDFEKAVLITFNYGGNIDPSLKVPAYALSLLLFEIELAAAQTTPMQQQQQSPACMPFRVGISAW